MVLRRLKIGQKMFLGFGMITILMLAIIGYSYTNFTKQSADVENNLHSYNVIRESDAIVISLVNMETGARGFALTGKKEFWNLLIRVKSIIKDIIIILSSLLWIIIVNKIGLKPLISHMKPGYNGRQAK